jgi:hypothetical protein
MALGVGLQSLASFFLPQVNPQKEGGEKQEI